MQNIKKQLKTKESVTYDKLDQEVIVRTRRKKIMGPFSAVGKLSSVKNNDGNQDIFDLLTRVSKGAFNLFNELKCHRSENNNLAEYSTVEFTKTRKETFSRNLTELRKQGIVRITQQVMVARDPQRPYHLAKQTYMINPDLLKCWDYEDASILWEQCKP